MKSGIRVKKKFHFGTLLYIVLLRKQPIVMFRLVTDIAVCYLSKMTLDML